MSEDKTSHLHLLFDIGYIAELLADASGIDTFLKKATELVAHHLDADVCSIYLYEDSSDTLVLKATLGLSPGAVNTVRMKPGEGLVGHSFDIFAPIRVGDARQHPKFKYFSEAGEDPYHSFISVPIKRGVERIGVLVVQKRACDFFEELDVRALVAAASQLAGALENIRLLMEVGRRGADKPTPYAYTGAVIHGKPASGGYAFAATTVLKKYRSLLLFPSPEAGHACKAADFATAVKRTASELSALQEGFIEHLPESASLIFTAHFLMLKDKSFTGEMAARIDSGVPPIDAVKQVAIRYIDLFTSSTHAYMREKALDVEDLALRILRHLKQDPGDEEFSAKRIAIAAELFPSDILKLASAEVPAIILVGGGVASHVAILSRSLRIPLVIADEPGLMSLKENTPVLVDAEVGNIYIQPTDEMVRLFESSHAARESASVKAGWMADTTCTKDGVRVSLLANINLLREVKTAKALKAEGIGLYRTEFPFLIRSTFPSEAEQYVIYKRLFDDMENRVVTIRTLDAGGEKALAYSNAISEENPELGLRAIRFTFKHRDVFENQIRAVLRAAAGKQNARLMFPLVSSVDELEEAKAMVAACAAALDREWIDHHPSIEIGIMIELPSVLATIDAFAEAVDFFSIGTNDFVQYMLAADRTNKLVESYYLPHHPAVIRGLNQIVQAAKRAKIDVSICGEMAHETRYLPFLLGIGARSLSIDPQFLPEVQQVIARIDLAEAEAHAHALLDCTSIKQVEAVLAEAELASTVV